MGASGILLDVPNYKWTGAQVQEHFAAPNFLPLELPVSSSVYRADYDPEAKTLFVSFLGRDRLCTVYAYPDFDSTTVDSFRDKVDDIGAGKAVALMLRPRKAIQQGVPVDA